MTAVNDARLSIDQLATAAGLTRRGVRFYVQQRLLPAPHGVGRGNHYDQAHLDRLRQIRDLQSAGHSLEEIRHILAGDGNGKSRPAGVTPAQPSPASPRRSAPKARPTLRAELWRRVFITEGVELSFDAARFNPTVECLLALRAAIAATFDHPDSDSKETP